jgi:high-affinity iron transporter
MIRIYLGGRCRYIARRMLKLIALTFTTALAAAAAAEPEELLQLVDYVAVDYPAAVVDGRVVSDAEYAEMREFTRRAVELAGTAPDSSARSEILARAQAMSALVEARAPVAELRAEASALRRALLASSKLDTAPRRKPDLALGADLYSRECAACHGAAFDGLGPAAAGLEPQPTAFSDDGRARQRSVYALYSTVTRGVDGTAMRAYAELGTHERWSLAWYVGSRYLTAPAAPIAGPLPELPTYASGSPAELVSEGVPADTVAALRLDPSPLFPSEADPLAVARTKLAAAGDAHRDGDREGAYRLALDAYLDGFELAEASLRAVSPQRIAEVEAAMLALREQVRRPDQQAVTASIAALDIQLAELAARRDDPDALSPGVAFGSSYFILLREGIEALLLVGLIVTVLIKTGHREGLRAVHTGWVAALALGAATWAVSSWLIVISGATRELTEGFAALLACAVLLYVGFWMHDKLAADRWQRFMQDQIEAALGSGSRWTLGLLSFIAVYREVFETVLFYQALWVQGGGSDVQRAIVLGGVGAVASLAAIAWGIFALGMRLPLRQFFALSAILMVVLALVFAGKGVAALQEAGQLAQHALPLPRIELLGIYPNAQGLVLQAALLGLVVAMVLYNRRRAAVALDDRS